MYFCTAIPDLTFTIGGSHALVAISVDGSQVYSETLYPVGGVVAVRDLQSLLTLYAERSLVVDVAVSITEYTVTPGGSIEVYGISVPLPDSITATDTKSLSFQVAFCRVDVGTSASDFTSKHFLSILLGTKLTAEGRLEYLHYLGSDTPVCTAMYADGSRATFTPQQVGGNSRYTTLDVSPDRFQTAGKQLVSYVVEAGQRHQQYDLDPSVPDCAPILLFDNSFGVQELIYCTGTHEVAPEYKREQARIGGLLVNYNIEETRVFHADTGYLNRAMANWADELFRSREVYLVNIYDGQPTVGKQVVLSDSDSKFDNEDATMPRFTFSYQYAQRVQNVIDLRREGRIFDNTFDFTFN